MGDITLKRLQLALEGAYANSANSTNPYQGGTAGLPATHRLAIKEDVEFTIDPVLDRPVEARNTYAGVYTTIEHMMSASGKGSMAMYTDDLRYLLRMSISGSPSVYTLPNTPVALLAATAIAATMNLTTQPNGAANGAMLALTLANTAASTTAVVLTITGTALNGAPLTETVNFSAGTTTSSAVGGGSGALSVTLYTKNYFVTVTSITTSAQPTGDTVTVGGVYAFEEIYLSDMSTNTLQSATFEYYDGTASWQVIGALLNKLTMNAQFGKVFDVQNDFLAQRKIDLVGNTTSIVPNATAGLYGALQNLADYAYPAIGTTLARMYADPLGTAPGTTLVSNRVVDAKFSIDNGFKYVKTGNGVNYPTMVGRADYGSKLSQELTLLFENYNGNTVDPAEMTAFLTAAPRTVRIANVGSYFPCGQLATYNNWPSYLTDIAGKAGAYGIAIDLAGTYTKQAEKAVNQLIAHTYTLESQVDLVSMGVPLQITITTRMNPNV